jgi:MFS family permease
MPVLMLCYIMNYLDRSNIGMAKLQFLRDLGMRETAYGLAAGSFYLGYILFGVPVNLVLGKIGARPSLLIIMTLWGLLSASLAFITSPGHFYAIRFLIGVAEAGFLPAVLLYLSRWIPQSQRARFNGIFLSAIAVAGLVGPAPLGVERVIFVGGGSREVADRLAGDGERTVGIVMANRSDGGRGGGDGDEFPAGEIAAIEEVGGRDAREAN